MLWPSTTNASWSPFDDQPLQLGGLVRAAAVDEYGEFITSDPRDARVAFDAPERCANATSTRHRSRTVSLVDLAQGRHVDERQSVAAAVFRSSGAAIELRLPGHQLADVSDAGQWIHDRTTSPTRIPGGPPEDPSRTGRAAPTRQFLVTDPTILLKTRRPRGGAHGASDAPGRGRDFDLRAVYDSPIRTTPGRLAGRGDVGAPDLVESRAGAPATVPGQLSAVTAALLSWPLSCAKYHRGEHMSEWSGQSKQIAASRSSWKISTSRSLLRGSLRPPVHYEDANSAVFQFTHTLLNLLKSPSQ